MAGLSDYLEKKILDHWLGGPDYTRPATVYVGLYTVAPSDAAGGTEVSGNAYARVAVTNNSTNWPAASGTLASKSNANAITFPTASGGDWGNVVAFGIFDDPTAGNLLGWGTVTKTIQNGDTASFAAGTLTATQD